jgi:hypothetical protein
MRTAMKRPNACGTIASFLVPGLFVAVYLFLWNAPAVHLRDPWYEAYSQVVAATGTHDTIVNQRLLDYGGAALRALCAQYPYHARVHFLLGGYYYFAGNYDSAMVQANQAIALGRGATVNQVDGIAGELLDAARAKKASLTGNGPGGSK